MCLCQYNYFNIVFSFWNDGYYILQNMLIMLIVEVMPWRFNFSFSGSQNPVQLSYYFYQGNLVLQCEVLNPYLSVFIVDFNDREQGHCRPIPVPKCFNYFKRETKLSFNNITNVTTFIKGASDMSKIIGKWTCKHGSGEGNPSSTIYVTMSK